jgi:hypothetical protein
MAKVLIFLRLFLNGRIDVRMMNGHHSGECLEKKFVCENILPENSALQEVT